MNPPAEKFSANRLLDPLFLVALALLLLNDHWWKGSFYNFFTGKLSDFSGLYAFAWVGLSLCGPRLARLRGVHAILLGAIGLAFAFWKSPWSGPLLADWNALDLLPLQRVVDYGDWAAIAVLPLASRRYLRGKPFSWVWLGRMSEIGCLRRGLQAAGFGLSIFAFCATSYKNDFVIDKPFDIEIPPAEVVQQLNALSDSSGMSNLPLSLHHGNANLFEPFIDDSIYRHSGAVPPQYADTMYVNPNGLFRYSFRLRKPGPFTKNQQQCADAPAMLRLVPKGSGSQLTLMQIELMNCKPMPENDDVQSPESYLEKRFVEEVVNYLNRH